MVDDEDFDYKGRLLEIQTELDSLNKESIELVNTIARNLKELL
jgi:hypothetical protein